MLTSSTFHSVSPSMQQPAFVVLMEHFTDPERLREAITCSQKCTAFLKNNHALNECCPVHPHEKQNIFCQQCMAWICRHCTSSDHINHRLEESSSMIREEAQKLEESMDTVTNMLEEMKQEISGVQKMKQRVRMRKDSNINIATKVFTALRMAVDEREKQIISDIIREADVKEKTLELQLERLVLLWSQLKSCLELMKKTREERNVKIVDFINRRKMLEQRRDHLMVMKRKSQAELLERNEPREINFEGVEQLHRRISKLGYTLDPSKCEAAIPTPTMIVNEEATVMITVRDVHNDPVCNVSEKLNVSIQTTKNGEAIAVKTIDEVDDGRYKATFTPTRCGDLLISILVDGYHVPDSPYRIPVDRDYSKITEDCDQVVTDYGRNKFGGLTDVTVGPNDEIIIVDYGYRCIVVLDSKFNLLRVIGQARDGKSRLTDPFCVAVVDDIIAVSDQRRSHQIKKYSLQGNLLSIIGTCGDNIGQFQYPSGLVFNSDKLLYVVDRLNCRIQVFRQDNTFVLSFGTRGSGPGQFEYPLRIAVDPSDNILISDRDNHCVQLFSRDGNFMKKIDCYRPFAVTVSPTGYIITGHDDVKHMITIWSPAHQLIKQFGKEGSQRGEFYDIRGVSVGSTGDVYVVEGYNQRLHVIRSGNS